jgi:ankyrin repeat protein
MRVEQQEMRPTEHTFWAAVKSNKSYLVQVLARYVNVDAADEETGYTALQHAVMSGDADMVRVLLNNSANPALETPRGEDSFDLALAKGHPGISNILLQSHHRQSSAINPIYGPSFFI